ncbi:MAG: hypothetical protein ACQEWG_08500, partial [Bacteroidota bacterium]
MAVRKQHSQNAEHKLSVPGKALFTTIYKNNAILVLHRKSVFTCDVRFFIENQVCRRTVFIWDVVMHMKKLTLQRPKERFNKNYSYEIFVGNIKLTELKNGEEKVVEISDELNNEQLRAKIQWCGSEKYDVSELKDNTNLKICGNDFLNRKAIWIIAILPITGALMFGYGRDNLTIKYIGIGLFFSILLFAFWGTVIAKNK